MSVTMWTRVSHIENDWRSVTEEGARVSIHPQNRPPPVLPDGRVNLYNQACESFPRLAGENLFTGAHNVFAGPVQVRRCHVVSDPREKTAVRPLAPAAGAALVRAVPAYVYELDGRPAAGLLASGGGGGGPPLPPSCEAPAAGGAGGPRSLDYNALLAHLWAAVQDLQRRLDTLGA